MASIAHTSAHHTTSPAETSIGPAIAERHGQRGLSPTLRLDFTEPDSATCQVQIVQADAATTFDAIRTTDFADSRLVMTLSRLRELPDRVIRRLRGRTQHPRAARATIVDLIEAGYWVVLTDRPPRELALGLSMWDERIEQTGLSMETFHRPGQGAVRVGWAFTVEPLGDNRSLLITETRAQGVDDDARRRFRRYWRAISPFAGLTRRLVLKAIAAEAERSFKAEPHQGRDRIRVRRLETPVRATEESDPSVHPSDVYGLTTTELRRIAADPSDRRRHTALHQLDVRAKRDAMCSAQGAWNDYEVPGDAEVGGEVSNASTAGGL